MSLHCGFPVFANFHLYPYMGRWGPETSANLSGIDLPPVKPSAIALGTLFCHGTELAGKFTPWRIGMEREDEEGNGNQL